MSLHHGDCLDFMAGMAAESVDAICTDPPYDLTNRTVDVMGCEACGRTMGGRDGDPDACPRCGGALSYQRSRQGRGFMGKAWDGTGIAFDPATWAAMLRVAKPSAYLLAFGGTRTVHRMTVALEDAGWIIRDMLVWAYASGFPKSKASLKPAWEPIVMARKPGPLRELAIDACRIGVEGGGGNGLGSHFGQATVPRVQHGPDDVGTLGRWPANVILTDPIFDGGWDGVVGGGASKAGGAILGDKEYADIGYHGNLVNRSAFESYADSGTYSRFFLVPKADRADREPVLGGLPRAVVNITEGHGRGPVNTSKGDGTGIRENRPRSNSHPTVKPVDLMRHLVRLVTPTGGTVLDPFLGSGSTALAAEMEGFAWIGIERELEYVRICEARLNGTQRGLGLPA